MTRRLLCSFALLAGCGSTGSALVTFTGKVGGPGAAAAAFDTPLYHVALTSASFHVGAIYLNTTPVTAGGPEQPCVLPGIYDGEVFGSCDSGPCGIDVDLLSGALVTFGSPGRGTATRAHEAQVWLTGTSDINAAADATTILRAAGTATARTGGAAFPFTVSVTIGQNRKRPPTNPAFPGRSPICRERIVSPIPIDFQLTQGGTLVLQVDPTKMFDDVDFAQLMPTNGVYIVPDDQSAVGNALFQYGVRSQRAYPFTWTP